MGEAREARRKRKRLEDKLRRQMWPGGFVEVPNDLRGRLSHGDRFTIKGVKRFEDGTFITNCKAGEETVFRAKLR